ncbi:MAG: hypothetical protein Q3971_08785 [Moraxella sp.]|nr:hypothetical protein [Moraxella sp.]
MSNYKDLIDDAPNRIKIAIPFVIMRENIDKETFIQSEAQHRKSFMILGLVLASFSMGFSFFMGANMSRTLDGLGVFILMWGGFVLCFYFYNVFDHRNTKKLLSVFDNLPKKSPFIKVNPDTLFIYDVYGQELVAIAIHKIQSVYLFRFKGYVGLHIDYQNNHSQLERFEYPLRAKIEYEAKYYFEYENECYVVKSLAWMIGSMVDVLQKDPTATHFPFVKKNYINGRVWDDP